MRNLRTEKEIMANWKGDLTKPVVSVCCITYNHEPYIEDALEGFLIQETDFQFEIIIHDDASTDKTADIIREYISAYPNIIKPILQTENQYSINVHLPFKNTYNIATGEYLALCEGDDYWISPEKLQMQLELLKNNSDFNIVASKAKTFNETTKKYGVAGQNKNQVIHFGKVIYSSGSIITATILVRASIVKSLPDFVLAAPVGDYFIQVLGANNKGALYIDREMAVYRKESQSSVTKNELSLLEKRMFFCVRMYSSYNLLEEHVGSHKFHFFKRKLRFKIWNFVFFIRGCHFNNALKVLVL